MDSNIISQLQGIKIPDPVEGLKKTLILQHLMGKNRLQEAKIAQVGRPKPRDPKADREAMSQLAIGMLSVAQQDRAAVYPEMVAQWRKVGLPELRPLPGQWDDSFLPGLQQLAGLSSQQAMKRQDYRDAGPPEVPGSQSPALSALQATSGRPGRRHI